MRKLLLKNGQTWHLSTQPGPPPGNERWGACVLVSRIDLPLSAGDLAARAAIGGRCPSIVVVAPNAEAIHDRIDSIVEADGAIDTLTTFHAPDALEDALSLLDAGLAGEGPIYAFSDSLSFLEDGLRDMGFVS